MKLILQIALAIVGAVVFLHSPMALMAIAVIIAPFWILGRLGDAIFYGRIPDDAEALIRAALTGGKTVSLPIKQKGGVTFRPVKILGYDRCELRAVDLETKRSICLAWRDMDRGALVCALTE